MAGATTTTKAAKNADDLVEVYLPPKNKDDPNFFVSVNDKQWIIPRGTTQKVPRYVADEIRRAEAADRRRYYNQLEMLEQAGN